MVKVERPMASLYLLEMHMNKDVMKKAGEEFLKNYGREEKDSYSKFRALKFFKGEANLLLPLHPLSMCADIWTHHWTNKGATRTICVKAHYGLDCEICSQSNQWGQRYPKFDKLMLCWNFSNVGKTWTPEKGPNKGKPVDLDPWCTVSIEKGENSINWNLLERANTQGFGFPDSPDKGTIWEAIQVEGVGFRIQPVPIAVIGKAVSPHPSADIADWIKHATEDDIYGQQLATLHGVDWKLFDVKEPPEREKKAKDGKPAPYGGNKDTTKDTEKSSAKTSKLTIQEDGEVLETKAEASKEAKEKVATATAALQEDKAESDEDPEIAAMLAAVEEKKKKKDQEKKDQEKKAKLERERLAKEKSIEDEDPEIAALKAKVEEKKKAKLDKDRKAAAAEAAAATSVETALVEEGSAEDELAKQRAAKKAKLLADLEALDSSEEELEEAVGKRDKLVTA